MQPVVVPPPRSSQTRSVLARFLVRFSGYGILTDVTRLTTLRTSSRSAADAGGQEMPCSRTASTKSVDFWSIGNAFPGRAHSFVTELRAQGRHLDCCHEPPNAEPTPSSPFHPLPL